jgi:predicted polyphosphate/ATP-dependent NAD kinase
VIRGELRNWLTMQSTRENVVGIIANPASGRDIRRLVAQGGVFTIAEKCSIIIRLVSALGVTGVGVILMIPDRGGIAERVRRALAANDHPSHHQQPKVVFLAMPVEDGPADTVRGTTQMVAAGARAIVVLGGDGTQRLVAGACGEVPIMPLSTGTNNVFPESREATIAGLATGLVAVGKISAAEATVRNKILRLEMDGVSSDLAVVDISVAANRWVGSRALWRPEALDQIFVTFAEPDAIGLSSVAGLMRPVSRRAPHGLRIDLAPPDRAKVLLMCPIAPGLILPVGIEDVQEIHAGEMQNLRLAQGTIALDGEREFEYGSGRRPAVRLDGQGPYTIDIDKVMQRAAEERLLAIG